MAGKFKAELVPRHYVLNATLDADGMFELIMSLRRFVDEFDAPDVTHELLAALTDVFAGDLPQTIEALPEIPGDEEDDGETADT